MKIISGVFVLSLMLSGCTTPPEGDGRFHKRHGRPAHYHQGSSDISPFSIEEVDRVRSQKRLHA
tara:strand:- start:487 stop:678 length:192 start_codon:yes stop_codon:yes gene_type:complete